METKTSSITLPESVIWPKWIVCDLWLIIFLEWIELKKSSIIKIELGPESLITARAPAPEGVAKAIIVSFRCNSFFYKSINITSNDICNNFKLF